MDRKFSKRLGDIVDALGIKNGMRILEIGCGPGAMAREMVKRMDSGFVLGIDRSAKAIQQAVAASQDEIKSGRLSFRQVSIEKLKLNHDEEQFDIAIAVRVGALDGRHPEIERQALTNISKALTKKGKLFIDGGNPLKEIPLNKIF